MNKTIKIISFIVTLVIVFCVTGCKKQETPKPILKVMTSDSPMLATLRNDQYYEVYDNGKVKKIPEFDMNYNNHSTYTFSDEKTETVMDIDINTDDGKRINAIGENIISLTENESSISVLVRLYLMNDKVYFTAWLKKGWINTYTAIYEYNEDGISIKKIAVIKNPITHMEPY